MIKTKFFLLSLIVILAVFVAIILRSCKSSEVESAGDSSRTWWEVQSIDTVKYSRDIAREKANNPSFDSVIEKQVSLIAGTGATHIAIGTPYDSEFLPFFKRWVVTARKYGLKVWFRGNLAGWEGWFGYPKLSKVEHIEKTKEFILSNGELFEDGDIFSSCPECENGALGDPRLTGDVRGYRKFLIEEYKVTNDSFRKVGKNVRSNFIPMNGDVANLVMDKETTKELGGIVVIDHYVANPNELVADIKKIAQKSGGRVVLGEFGAPIPDIHGNFSDLEQSIWIKSSLERLSEVNDLLGVNYWVSFGGSTKLWNDDGAARPAVGALKTYFKPKILTVKIVNQIQKPVEGARIDSGNKSAITNKNGEFSIPYISELTTLTIEKDGYLQKKITIREASGSITLIKDPENFIFAIEKFFFNLFN